MSAPVILAALVAVLVWGASPVATKVAVADLAAYSVALLRTLGGGAVCLTLLLVKRISPPRGFDQRRLLGLSGFCGFIGFPLLFSFGVARTSAIHAALILAILPVITGALAMTWDRQSPRMSWWTGCAIAVAGEAFLILSKASTDEGSGTLQGDALVLVSTFFAAAGYVAGGRLHRTGYPAEGVTYWGAALAAVVLLPIAGLTLEPAAWVSVSVRSWAGVAYLAVGVTIVGYMLWYYALGQGGIARVGLFQFLQPISGVLLGWLLLHEPLGVVLWVATAIILIGVWLAMRASAR